jgi:hypothetical protein
MNQELIDPIDDGDDADDERRDEDVVGVAPVPLMGAMAPVAGVALAMDAIADSGPIEESEEDRGVRVEQDDPTRDETA